MEIEFDGPVGTLRGELESPAADPRGAAIVCHPHPLHGGSMRNTVVVRTARALRSVGFRTLRFNFRGVEGSEGRHDGRAEVDDAQAALDTVAKELPDVPLWVAGYSFGSRIVSELALRGATVERVILIAFPARISSAGFLAELRCPGLVIAAGADAFGTAADLRSALPSWPERLTLVEIPGADHLFRGSTPLVEQAVLEYARAASGS